GHEALKVELLVQGEVVTAFANVLIGEVWLCSGQSNMQWPVGASVNAEQEIAEAEYPEIRFFTVPVSPQLYPQSDVASGAWSVCSPKTVGGFSAAGYFFGRDLQKALTNHPPIGLINSSVGGTPAQAWTSIGALREGGFTEYVDFYTNRLFTVLDETGAAQAQYDADMADHLGAMEFAVPDIQSEEQQAFLAADAGGWKTMYLPVSWRTVNGMERLNGVVWFRNTVAIPEEWVGKALTLKVGKIGARDDTFFGGERIGGGDAAGERAYAIPETMITDAGPAAIDIRVVGIGADSGICDGELSIAPADGSAKAISLAGPWRYTVAFGTNEVARPMAPKDLPHHTPSVLYNGMIAPFISLPMAGVIWYQGEANAYTPQNYHALFSALINDWRATRGTPPLPFLWAQLANYSRHSEEPIDREWSRLREAQTQTLKLPVTGQAVLIDVGDKGIHPPNKQAVGYRLALNARAIVYGEENLVYRSPTCTNAVANGNTLTVFFDTQGAALEFRGDTAKAFALASTDGDYAWATARIDGHTVICTSEDVSQPFRVRYAWDEYPVAPLFNSEGLPATPFQFNIK
ncbi:MAG: sialate O-acetylesterase, partial [Kiritimatiellaeota bacterium]|nr:sialate O-acetylesterase [Kiritimatiellota bacterium]